MHVCHVALAAAGVNKRVVKRVDLLAHTDATGAELDRLFRGRGSRFLRASLIALCVDFYTESMKVRTTSFFWTAYRREHDRIAYS